MNLHRKPLAAIRCRDAKRLDRARANVRQQHRDVEHDHIDVTTEQVIHRRCCAAAGLECEAGPARKLKPSQRVAKTFRRGCPVGVPAILRAGIEPL